MVLTTMRLTTLMKSLVVLHFHKANNLLDMEFINITQDTIDVSAHLHATYTEYNQLLKNYNTLESSRSFSKPSQIPDILSQMRTIYHKPCFNKLILNDFGEWVGQSKEDAAYFSKYYENAMSKRQFAISTDASHFMQLLQAVPLILIQAYANRLVQERSIGGRSLQWSSQTEAEKSSENARDS